MTDVKDFAACGLVDRTAKYANVLESYLQSERDECGNNLRGGRGNGGQVVASILAI